MSKSLKSPKVSTAKVMDSLLTRYQVAGTNVSIGTAKTIGAALARNYGIQNKLLVIVNNANSENTALQQRHIAGVTTTIPVQNPFSQTGAMGKQALFRVAQQMVKAVEDAQLVPSQGLTDMVKYIRFQVGSFTKFPGLAQKAYRMIKPIIALVQDAERNALQDYRTASVVVNQLVTDGTI